MIFFNFDALGSCYRNDIDNDKDNNNFWHYIILYNSSSFY